MLQLPSKKKQTAGVLLYVLILLPVLVTFAAFVIDFGFIHTNLDQARAYTRLLSLISLETTFDEEAQLGIDPDRPIPSELGDRIKLRINILAKKNHFVGDQREFKDIRWVWEASEEDNAGGTITPGVFFADPIGELEKDMDSDSDIARFKMMCADKYPCFLPFDTLSKFNSYLKHINSYRVVANYNQGIPMQLFGSFLGDPLVPIKTCALADTKKKSVVFVVDISASSVAETYIRRSVPSMKYDPQAGRGGYYVYTWDIVNDATLSTADCDKEISTNPNFPDSRSEFCHWRFLRDFDETQQDPEYAYGAGLLRTSCGNMTPDECESYHSNRTMHYADDFVAYPSDADKSLVTIFDRGDYRHNGYHGEIAGRYPTIELQHKTYLIDTHTDPQPLTNIFNGLLESINLIDANKVSGDKAGFIFFEKTLVWSRVVKLTDAFDYLKQIANFSMTNRQALLNKLALFPAYEGNTDIRIAIERAKNEILRARGSDTAAGYTNSIIYIGDFLANCTSKRLICAKLPSLAECSDGLIAPTARLCSDSYGFYSTAIEELWNEIIPELNRNSISLNVIQLGAQVGPHTIDLPVTENLAGSRCYTEQEARLQGLGYIMGGTESGYTPTDFSDWSVLYSNMNEQPFYQAGFDAYRLVRATGGLFIPILDSQDPCTQQPSECKQPTRGAGGLKKYFRRKTDRQCRSQAVQISDGLKSIIGQESPFRVANTGSAPGHSGCY